MTGTEPTAFQPPYMSWATFEGIIDQLAATGIPDQIDRSVLASRSGGDQSQFLRAARSFGLIGDDDVPTERLRALVGEPENRGEIYKQILHENYEPVIALGTGATQQQLTDRFREFGIEGETIRKAIAFYLNAAKQAEIPLSPRFKSTRPGSGGRKTGNRRKSTTKPGAGDPDPPTPPAPPSPLGDLHPAIVTLVQALPTGADPAIKPEFSKDEREAWFAYARATFNLIYALPEGDEPSDGDRETTWD